MENVMYNIVTLLISILGLVITYFVVPWLKAKTNTQQLTTIEMWVNIAVAAAEQMKAAGIITTPKKDYVLQFLKDKGVTITDQELDALIEAAVYEINKAKNLLFADLALQKGVTVQGEVLETEFK